jgi:hypothetical protein|tara:strand:- start:1265 stop:1450 length:186 start_codon:yes stop_codon:yes gene_type:complete
MAYHIKKPSLINSSINVYYTGNRRWTDDFSERKVYSSDPSGDMTNSDGKNGGWTGATVVSE